MRKRGMHGRGLCEGRVSRNEQEVLLRTLQVPPVHPSTQHDHTDLHRDLHARPEPTCPECCCSLKSLDKESTRKASQCKSTRAHKRKCSNASHHA